MDFFSGSPEAIATLVSATVAITLGFIGVRSQRRLHKREYTLEVLSHSLTNHKIMAGKNLIRRLQADEKIVDPDVLPVEEMDSIVNVLSYYEFICSAFLKGDLHKPTVIDQMAGSFLLTFDCAKQYIDRRRKERERPKTYIGLEKMANHIRENNL